jgi:putative membrane-bound dehydrogenase-like protein
MVLGIFSIAEAAIPEPRDAPQPRTPEETVASYQVPEGFRLELVASDPLIQSPSGVCWDAAGRLYVSELHGYNLEGQLDIEALNKTGELDLEVRRVQADERFKKAALSGTNGVIKRLADSDGDGRMDEAVVFAKDLPPVYGMVAARGGIIAACAPDIVFLADRDGDGMAEEREVLYTGFELGPLERGINAPQWSEDGWITFGRGAGGGLISGPHLEKPVELPRTDFRIRPDGTVIEPVTGGTHTFGFTYTAEGDRFVVSTTAPAIQIAPVSYRYLIRNPDAASDGLQKDITPDRRAYPISEPHPWRKKRAEHAEYFEYYSSRYGASDSDPGGWFTSGCSPFVYQDDIMPSIQGQFFACDPAQNFIFRGVFSKQEDPKEVLHTLSRHPDETSKEFLASTDSWSHPMALSHGPDGAVWIVDYYREIIEDYSAIPRHLQQQYGLYRGHDRGRIYRLTHSEAKPLPSPNLGGLSNKELVMNLTSGSIWRRETAKRLLLERDAREAVATVRDLTKTSLLAMELLYAWNELRSSDLVALLGNENPTIRVRALRYAEDAIRVNDSSVMTAIKTALESEVDGHVILQAALSLGESATEESLQLQQALARKHGDVRWLPIAITSSLYQCEVRMLELLGNDPGKSGAVIEALQDVVKRRTESAQTLEILDLTTIEKGAADLDDEEFQRFVRALASPRDTGHGEAIFQQHCALCHRVGDVGYEVAPDILGEIGAGEEALLRQLLIPQERIRPGFETTVIELKDGGAAAGILKDDGATSLTLAMAGGVKQTILRKRVKSFRQLPVSLMPPNYRDLLSPKDAADVLGWLVTTGTPSALPKIGQRLSDSQVNDFAQLALRGIFQEYPNKPSNVIRSAEGVRGPKEMHPVFYGCFDWHSSVHGHWMLLHLLRTYPEAPVAVEIEKVLEKQFQMEGIKKEVAYFEETGNSSFERMYGWAWTLRLAAELHSWDDERAQLWAAAFQPLEDKIVELTKGYLPRLSWPIRTGVHPDTAFALSLSLDYARTVENHELATLLLDRARDFYVKDRDYPPAYEPSGEDFFSGGLNEADLMRRVRMRNG